MSRLILAAALAAAGVYCQLPADSNAADAVANDGAAAGADSSVVVLTAGDIAACTPGSSLTARILDTIPGTIVIPGDAAYYSSVNRQPYRTCFDTTWGRHKARIRPVPGNHDADPDGMKRYFDYFGDAAGPRPGGYYSFDIGDWHVIALNSNIAMGPSSPQGQWAARDLASNSRRCTMAVMHHPRFSSGPHPPEPTTAGIWPLLDSAGVDLVVSGHDHLYERLAPMRANGRRDYTRGIRTFVVGVGGNMLYGFGAIHPASERRQNRVYGILKLTLSPRSYAWEFIPAQRTTFRDSGRAPCH